MTKTNSPLLLTLILVLLLTALPVLALPVSGQPLHQQMLTDLLEQHPAVRAAQLQRQAAAQEVQGARWQYFPTPSVGAERSNPTSAFIDSQTRFVRLQQPLWTGGRLSAQTERARAQQDQADAAWHEQRHDLGTRWLEFWAEASAARQRVEAYVESEALHQRYVQRVRARATAGQIARSEIQLSLSRLANVQAELEQARTQQQQALNRLQQIWGAPWPATLQSLPELPAADLPAAGAQAPVPPDDHPVLGKVRAQIELARSELALARARLSPEIYARGEITHGNISGEVRKAYIGISSSYGAGLSNLTAIGSAQSRVDALQQELEARRKDLTDLLTGDQLQALSQTQRARQLRQALLAAQAYLLSSETQFDNGRRSWQELMNSAREKAQIHAQLADSTAQAWLAAERLRLNLQGLDSYLAAGLAPVAATQR